MVDRKNVQFLKQYEFVSLDGMIKNNKEKTKELLELFYQNGHRLAETTKMLSEFVDIIVEWSRVHNIVSKYYDKENLWENIFDSLSVINSLEYVENISDAGAGGGFPGLILAIALPKKKFTLIDSDRKKCSFLRLVKSRLNLDNVEICNKRLESSGLHSFIVSKAAFSPKNIHILPKSLTLGGTISLWVNQEDIDAFMVEMDKEGFTLTQKIDYQVAADKNRSILIFQRKLG